MKYLLNSAVITSPGYYTYRLITPEIAREWYAEGPVPTSTIGYVETAKALELLLGREIPVNRISIRMEPGDQALVFRLVLPPGTPRISPEDKGRLQKIIEDMQWELGLLCRIN